MNIVNLLNEILIYALESQVSDIHLELTADSCMIKARVNGVLQHLKTLPPEAGVQVISRIKVMSRMDINEKTLPQDGQIKYEFSCYQTDIRAAWVPTRQGESMTIRVLKKIEDVPLLQELGMSTQLLEITGKTLTEKQGLLIISGPTGSGKTTTLYSMLNQLSCMQDKIITIEDPVEYIVSGLTQIQVNERLTFAKALRAALRHDPDILLVGEIRDQQTADIAVQAALTGHLVLATIHANSAAEIEPRLQSLGVEQYKIKAALKLSIAQRLLKQKCFKCKGKGCLECSSGVSKRKALFEYCDHVQMRQQSFAETFKIMLNKGKISRGEFFEENVYIAN